MLIAGPNLTIDRTLTIDELRPGEVLRFDGVAVTPGGKGVNVARVARALGAPALLVGFTPGRTGAAAAELIVDEGLRIEPVPTGGELRSTAVVLERGGTRDGHERAGAGDRSAGLGALCGGGRRAARGATRVLVCSGSVPPGAPPDAYGRSIELAGRAGVAAIVDGSGALLDAALRSGPAVVCPNLAEAEGLLHGRADETVEVGDPSEVRLRAARAAAELVRRGARAAVVTAGAAGAAVADGTTVQLAPGSCGDRSQPDRRGRRARRGAGHGPRARGAARGRGTARASRPPRRASRRTRPVRSTRRARD